MKAGAVDFIEKPFTDDVIMGSIAAALARAERLRHDDRAAADWARRLATLSPRELEVLQGLVSGHPNKTMAHDLGISPRTVEIHRARVMEKMGASSLAELVRLVSAIDAPSGPG